jgi:serine/threonine protein kinase
LERASEDLQTDDRITAASTLLHVIAELHAQDIAHRDLGPRSIWAASPTRFALTGFMACQMPDEESLGDWTGVLRGQGEALPEDADKNLAGTAKQRDVYALGRLAAEILTDGTPSGTDAAGTAEMAIPNIEAWLGRATARKASSRFSDAREMGDEFARLILLSKRTSMPKPALEASTVGRFMWFRLV